MTSSTGDVADTPASSAATDSNRSYRWSGTAPGSGTGRSGSRRVSSGSSRASSPPASRTNSPTVSVGRAAR